MSRFSVPFYFGGTSLLIMVVVIMDFQAQVAAHLMSHQYEGLMKKANLRGYGRPRAVAKELICHESRASVKKICKNCKIVRRRRVVYVICSRCPPQAAPGLIAAAVKALSY